MHLQTTKRDRDVMLAIQAMANTSLTLEEIQATLSGIVYQFFINMMDDEKTYFPYFGEIEINYRKDIIEDGFAEAQLQMTITPSPLVKRIAGQIKDGGENDLEKVEIHRIMNSLENIMEQ